MSCEYCELSRLLMHSISKKVVESALDNPERYCGWFWVHCSSKKFERMAREAMDVCLRVLKQSNKSRFDSYSRQEQCVGHIPYYLVACTQTICQAKYFPESAGLSSVVGKKYTFVSSPPSRTGHVLINEIKWNHTNPMNHMFLLFSRVKQLQG